MRLIRDLDFREEFHRPLFRLRLRCFACQHWRERVIFEDTQMGFVAQIG